MAKTRVPLIFGTMTMGAEGKNGVRNHDLAECQQILDVFFSNGHSELDTARMYADGTTEEWLGKLDTKHATIDTKVYPNEPGVHRPAVLRERFETSLRLLNKSAVRVFYLHAPDRSVPFEETLGECDRLHKEGKFEILGLSNYTAWEVAEIVGITRANGWVQPKIYQAMYNAITREIEPELVPACRKFGLRLVVYNPLAGGFFAGKVPSEAATAELEAGSRFAGSSAMAQLYRGRYVRGGYFRALELVKAAAERHGLRTTEIALRWCQHHSALTPADGVILGASSAAQLAQNCEDSEKGPLPADVLEALDAARAAVGADVPRYWR